MDERDMTSTDQPRAETWTTESDRERECVCAETSTRNCPVHGQGDDHGYAEHLREAREVEAHQEAKHGDG